LEPSLQFSRYLHPNIPGFSLKYDKETLHQATFSVFFLAFFKRSASFYVIKAPLTWFRTTYWI